MYCPSCGSMQPANAVQCGACGARLPKSPEAAVQESSEILGHFLPVNVSVWGVFAGYLGLFSFLIFPLGPFAIFCSIMTIRDLKRNPRHYGKLRIITGFVGGAIGTVVLALVLIAIAFDPGY